MKNTKHLDKRKYILKENKLKKKYYLIIIVFAVLGIFNHYFIEPEIIGKDYKYWTYVILLPTILGVFILGIYRKQFLINKFSINKGFVLRIFIVFFYLIQGIFFSFLSFGQVANISWNYYNNEITKQNPKEIINCQIIKFWKSKRRTKIFFKFNDKTEKILINRSTIREFENKNVNKYYLKIYVTKGLWNCYKVNDWDIVQK